MTAALHLVRMRVDGQRLYAFAKRSRAAAREFDEGYALHALFAALFDHGAEAGARVSPKPFHIVSAAGRFLDVLGYTHVDHQKLIERANAFADPLAWGVCDMESLASKPMPESFPVGVRLGFFVRACPIRRIAKRGPMTRARAEVDAFLARSWEVGADVPLKREDVYRDWLREELGKENAAKLTDASMEAFRLGRLHRRSHRRSHQPSHGDERKGHRTERPDVGFTGLLEVGDPEAFSRRLARGVGRHRTFGFGMLMLRPAPG